MPSQLDVSPRTEPMVDPQTGKVSARWLPWFSQLERLVRGTSENWTTANRPTAELFIGRSGFNTTLAVFEAWNGSVWVSTSYIIGDVTVDTGGVGIGAAVTSTEKLRVGVNIASGYAGYFFNDGDSANRRGIAVQCGGYADTDDQRFVVCFDGNGNLQGDLRNNTTGNMVLLDISDGSIKTHIKDTPRYDTKKIIQGLRPRNFTKHGSPGCSGFVAQEVEAVFPEMVCVLDEEEGLLGVESTTKLTQVLLQDAKERQIEIEQLTLHISKLEARLAKIEAKQQADSETADIPDTPEA